MDEFRDNHKTYESQLLMNIKTDNQDNLFGVDEETVSNSTDFLKSESKF